MTVVMQAESPKCRMGQGLIASAEIADDGSKFHNLQDAYRKLELKHAQVYNSSSEHKTSRYTACCHGADAAAADVQAQNRIKQLELLVRGRWEEAPAEGVVRHLCVKQY